MSIYNGTDVYYSKQPNSFLNSEGYLKEEVIINCLNICFGNAPTGKICVWYDKYTDNKLDRGGIAKMYKYDINNILETDSTHIITKRNVEDTVFMTQYDSPVLKANNAYVGPVCCSGRPKEDPSFAHFITTVK